MERVSLVTDLSGQEPPHHADRARPRPDRPRARHRFGGLQHLASNILFITLSLLLTCLILSGVMSWLNLRGACWRLLLQPPSRAGQKTPVTLELWNRKALLPTYGLWFELTARPVPTGPQRAEATSGRRPPRSGLRSPGSNRPRRAPPCRCVSGSIRAARRGSTGSSHPRAAAWCAWNWRAWVRSFRSAFCARTTAPGCGAK